MKIEEHVTVTWERSDLSTDTAVGKTVVILNSDGVYEEHMIGIVDKLTNPNSRDVENNTYKGDCIQSWCLINLETGRITLANSDFLEYLNKVQAIPEEY